MRPFSRERRSEQEHRSVLFAPAIAVMNRLKYPRKFALISLLFILPLALVMYFLLSEMNDRIDFAQKEVLGDRYLRTLRKLLEHVPQAGRLAHAYANGGVSLRPELIRKQAEIDEDLAAVAAVDQNLGGILQTAGKFAVLQENWRFLKTKTLSLDMSDTDELYTKLMADIRALISQVGDTSNLILDPDLDSYYLMDSVLLKLP